jgi:hypothetical protein
MSILKHEPMLRPLALSAERANRPTTIVAFTGVLLVAAFGFLLWSANGVGAAERRVERAKTEAADVQRVSAEITRMRSEESVTDTPDAKYRRNPNLLSTLSASADAAGLTPRPRIVPQKSDEQRNGALVRQNVSASISGQEIGDVLRWIESVLKQIDGLYVSQFKATPNRTTGWNIDVRFSRWELKQ